MDHFASDETLDSAHPTEKIIPGDKPGRATGPRTPEGKAKSSMNRLKHGCCSEKTVLRHESQEEFETHAQGWFDQYKPESTAALTLVQLTVDAHWKLKRNIKRVDDIEWNLPRDAWQWTESNHKDYSNALRYKTTAERSFFRAFKDLEAHYKRVHREEHLERLALAKAAQAELRWLTQKEEITAQTRKLDQTIEIEVIEGETRTSCYPSNQELRQIAAKLPNEPLSIRRTLVFFDGLVPAEYAWTNPQPSPESGLLAAIQTISYIQWREAVPREEAAGQIGPVRTHALRQQLVTR